jgi:hypothetical protein
MNGSDSSSCNNILKDCCKKYGNNDIMINNFQKPINSNQSKDNICNLSGVPNIEQKCMELCQTNINCKAYTLDTGTCNLYSSSTPNLTDKNNYGKIIFVAKK